MEAESVVICWLCFYKKIVTSTASAALLGYCLYPIGSTT